MQQKPLLMTKNGQNGVFDGNKRKFERLFIVFKAESKWKQEEQILLGVLFKKQKRTFSGVQNGTFNKSIFKFVFLRFVL